MTLFIPINNLRTSYSEVLVQIWRVYVSSRSCRLGKNKKASFLKLKLFSPMKRHFKGLLFLMWENIYVEVFDSTMEEEGTLDWLFQGCNYSQFKPLCSLCNHIALLCWSLMCQRSQLSLLLELSLSEPKVYSIGDNRWATSFRSKSALISTILAILVLSFSLMKHLKLWGEKIEKK